MDYQKIFEFYRRITGIALTEDEWSQFMSLGVKREIKKKEFFCRSGDDFRYFAIVLKGLFRLYYLGSDGKEYIKNFRSEWEVIGPYAEILQNVKVRTYIEAVEDSTILVFPYDEFTKLYRANPHWMELGNYVNEVNYIEKEEKEFNFLQLSATERYLKFQNAFSHIANRIPQYFVASYLGITPVALSRIVKKLKDKKEDQS